MYRYLPGHTCAQACRDLARHARHIHQDTEVDVCIDVDIALISDACLNSYFAHLEGVANVRASIHLHRRVGSYAQGSVRDLNHPGVQVQPLLPPHAEGQKWMPSDAHSPRPDRRMSFARPGSGSRSGGATPTRAIWTGLSGLFSSGACRGPEARVRSIVITVIVIFD